MIDKYGKLIQRLKDSSRSRDFDTLYRTIVEYTPYVIGKIYNEIPTQTRTKDILHHVATKIILRYLEGQDFMVTHWPMYIGLVLREVHRDEKYHRVQDLSYLVEGDLQFPEELLGIETTDEHYSIDFERAVKKFCQEAEKIFSSVQYKGLTEEQIILLKRIILYSGILRYNIYEILPEDLQWPVRFLVSRIKITIIQLRSEGLLSSKLTYEA